MDARTEKRIEELYRNAKQMPLLTVLGLLVPIVLLFAVPLGIVYFIECSRLAHGGSTLGGSRCRLVEEPNTNRATCQRESCILRVASSSSCCRPWSLLRTASSLQS